MATIATAAVAYEPDGELVLEEIKLANLQSKEILVDVKAVGICHTDSKFQKVLSLPGVFGHEGTGIVLDVGAGVTDVVVGDKVIMSYPYCTECSPCRESEPYKCENIPALKFAGQRFDGTKTISLNDENITSSFFQQSSFATKAITLEQSVIKVESDLLPELLAGLPCGVQTGAGAIFNTFNVAPNDSVLIIGAGAVGLSAVMAAKISSAYPVICIDINEERLALAKELGATHVFDAKSESINEEISSVANHGIKFVFESSASVPGLKTAISSIGQGGRIGIVSYPNGGEPFPFTTKELFLKVGSIEGIVQGSSVPKMFIPKLLALHKRGIFPFEKLITSYPFSEINSAIHDLHSGKTIKPVLVM